MTTGREELERESEADSLRAELAEAKARAEKAEKACVIKDAAIRSAVAGVWDGHYGGGVTAKYANAVQKEANIALSNSDLGSDYIRKADVAPLVVALKAGAGFTAYDSEAQRDYPFCESSAWKNAMALAKQLGLEVK